MGTPALEWDEAHTHPQKISQTAKYLACFKENHRSQCQNSRKGVATKTPNPPRGIFAVHIDQTITQAKTKAPNTFVR